MCSGKLYFGTHLYKVVSLAVIEIFISLPALGQIVGQEPQPAPVPIPIFENITLSPGFAPDPITIRGVSGGSAPVATLVNTFATPTGMCEGFIGQEPDHTLVLTDFFNFLSLEIQSPKDTTMIIQGPGGTWCNDDYGGKDPRIAGSWLSGTYDIWVGSYHNGEFYPYKIKITGTP
ncbi:MAG: hypothetical protein F6K19_17570 [Cyanothece sp. SIO1E1]|nr:hypothetical protein [Cyanothece sp. SIO1E1]